MAKEKQVKGEGREINVWVGIETIKDLDRLASKLNMSRSRLARNLLEMGMQDAKVLDLAGVLTAMHKIETLQRSFWKTVSV